MYLLDVNCLVALAWPNHLHHERIRRWFLKEGKRSWGTSPITQIGFLRVSMNAGVTGTEVSFPTATFQLNRLLAVGNHSLLPDQPVPGEWPKWLTTRLQGYRQITDASLLATAVAGDATLVTLDGAVSDLTVQEHKRTVFHVPV